METVNAPQEEPKKRTYVTPGVPADEEAALSKFGCACRCGYFTFGSKCPACASPVRLGGNIGLIRE